MGSSQIEAQFIPNNANLKTIQMTPDKVIRDVAKNTLNRTYKRIPFRTGHLANGTMANGVQQVKECVYKLVSGGNSVDYAIYPYLMRDSVNWTKSGTGNKWFEKTIKTEYNAIVTDAVIHNKLR